MNGARSFVVLTSGGDQGLQVVRHPTFDEGEAMEKAEEVSLANPGTIYYVAEVYQKVYTPMSPGAEWTRLI